MNKKLIVITIAIVLNLMVGCSNQSNDKISQKEKTTTSTDTVQNTIKEQVEQDEKEPEEKENLVSDEELKTKKEQYLERIENIYKKYENEYIEYEYGNLCNAEIRGEAIEAYEEYDKILNEIYQDLKKYLPEDKMQDVKEEQVKWISDTNKDKEYMIEMSTGFQTDLEMVYIIKDRCIELLDYLICDNDKVEETQNSNISTDEIINKLYKTLGESKNDVEYVYSPNDNYVSDNNIKNAYYIFQINTHIGGGDFITSDYNILVNKESYEIYNYYPNGQMEKVGQINK